MTYNEIMEDILTLPKFSGTASESFSNSRELMLKLGNPQDRFPTLHVAGSNGKGSVCAFLASALKENGLRVGLFTSPHLVDIRERIMLIDKKTVHQAASGGLQGGSDIVADCAAELTMCSREQFLEAEALVRRAVKAMTQEGKKPPGFFSYLFAIGMVLFREAGVECAVIETGLGGRFDATNTIKHPLMTAITTISLEHCEYLGETIAEIAGEKAGIIKPGVPLVFDGGVPEATEVITRTSKEAKAPALCVSPLPTTKEANSMEQHLKYIKILLNTGVGIDFSLNSVYDDKCNFFQAQNAVGAFKACQLPIPSSAPYQAVNGALAYATMLLLRKELPVSERAIRKGFACMKWPGRMEEITPGIYLDGAHNPGGIKAFLEAASGLSAQPAVLLFSMKREKHWKEAIRLLCASRYFEEVIVTTLPKDPGTLVARTAANYFRRLGEGKQNRARIVEIENPSEAFTYAVRAKRPGQLLFCTGSLYLVGEIRRRFFK